MIVAQIHHSRRLEFFGGSLIFSKGRKYYSPFEIQTFDQKKVANFCHRELMKIPKNQEISDWESFWKREQTLLKYVIDLGVAEIVAWVLGENSRDKMMIIARGVQNLLSRHWTRSISPILTKKKSVRWEGVSCGHLGRVLMLKSKFVACSSLGNVTRPLHTLIIWALWWK